MIQRPSLSPIAAIETGFDGCRFRSRTEARWAVFFKTIGCRYDYELEGVVLRSGPYLPDFWLRPFNIWFEVKGQQPLPREVGLATDLCAATGHDVVIAVGPPDLDDWNLIWIEPTANRPSIPDESEYWSEHGEGWRINAGQFIFSVDRVNEGEYWLQGDSGRMAPLGEHVGLRHGQFPVVGPERAYAAAKRARFEFGEAG